MLPLRTERIDAWCLRDLIGEESADERYVNRDALTKALCTGSTGKGPLSSTDSAFQSPLTVGDTTSTQQLVEVLTGIGSAIEGEPIDSVWTLDVAHGSLRVPTSASFRMIRMAIAIPVRSHGVQAIHSNRRSVQSTSLTAASATTSSKSTDILPGAAAPSVSSGFQAVNPNEGCRPCRTSAYPAHGPTPVIRSMVI